VTIGELQALTGDPWQLALTALYLAGAVGVTGHALLTKADGRAAVAWLALAWLSPYIGAAVYLLLGVNRVTRKAHRLAVHPAASGGPRGSAAEPVPLEAAQLAGVARVSERLTGRELTPGNRVQLYEQGDAALAAMLAAIGDAEHSVALTSYLFADDASGRRVAAALTAAHRRGVAARVLIDGVGGGYLRYPMLRRLRRAGVPAASFLHSWRPWRMPFLNLRNHKKLLVADGVLAFTGGMNITGATMAPRPGLRDAHAAVRGPAVPQLLRAFAEDWAFTTGERLTGPAWWRPPDTAGTTAARAITSGPDEDTGTLETVLAAAIVEARRRVRVVTPYFLPDRHLSMALSLAVLRGLRVEIVMPRRSNKRVVDWAARANLRFFTGAAGSVFLTPAPFDHAKLMTVDGTLTVLGSSNWDVRSHRLNFELDLEAHDPALTARVDAAIDARIAGARTLTDAELAARPRWQQLRDAAARLFLPYL